MAPGFVVPQVVTEARRSPGPKTRGWGCLAVGLAGALVASLLVNLLLVGSNQSELLSSDTALKEKYHSLNRHGKYKIAIIRVTGAILDSDGFVHHQIEAARKDKNVKAVVLRVDSPGGTVSASDNLYHQLTRLTKERDIPLVVSMGGIAASGGYYIAMAVGDTKNSIFAEPSSWTGSIGVIIPHYNVAGLMTKYEIEEDSIKSHPLKDIGSFTKKLTDAERVILQGLVDDSFNRFKDIIKEGRPHFADHPEELTAVATGQVFAADQAKEKRLIDKVGYLEDAIDRAIELAKLDKTQTRAMTYHRQTGLFEQMFIGPTGNSPNMELAKLLDLTAPRAYYLCSWLPWVEALRQE